MRDNFLPGAVFGGVVGIGLGAVVALGMFGPPNLTDGDPLDRCHQAMELADLASDLCEPLVDGWVQPVPCPPEQVYGRGFDDQPECRDV